MVRPTQASGGEVVDFGSSRIATPPRNAPVRRAPLCRRREIRFGKRLRQSAALRRNDQFIATRRIEATNSGAPKTNGRQTESIAGMSRREAQSRAARRTSRISGGKSQAARPRSNPARMRGLLLQTTLPRARCRITRPRPARPLGFLARATRRQTSCAIRLSMEPRCRSTLFVSWRDH